LTRGCILGFRRGTPTVSSHTTVEIFGRRFELRATDASERVEELARYVDRRMRELAEVSPHVDTSKLAVLTALNIADELFKEQETEPGTRSEELRQRVEGLIERLDEVLAAPSGGSQRV
jgi:cell division protein ZapA